MRRRRSGADVFLLGSERLLDEAEFGVSLEPAASRPEDEPVSDPIAATPSEPDGPPPEFEDVKRPPEEGEKPPPQRPRRPRSGLPGRVAPLGALGFAAALLAGALLAGSEESVSKRSRDGFTQTAPQDGASPAIGRRRSSDARESPDRGAPKPAARPAQPEARGETSVASPPSPSAGTRAAPAPITPATGPPAPPSPEPVAATAPPDTAPAPGSSDGANGATGADVRREFGP